MTTTTRPATAAPAMTGGLLPLRGYQQHAVTTITHHLATGGRRHVVAACGTGKTLVAAHAAIRLVPTGLVVLTCPSLALIAQTLRLWTAAGIADAVLAVCSDPTVARDTPTRVADLTCPVTTNPTQVAAWVQATTDTGRRLLLVTHLSVALAGHALTTAGTTADLVIVDEAHRTTGRSDKPTAQVHHDTVLPARRRLYLTATPRTTTRAAAPSVVAMDDPTIYGQRAFTYPFGQAILDGWLDDYQLAGIGITHAEALAHLQTTPAAAVDSVHDAPLRTAVVQVAIARAAVRYRLRRIIVFCPTLAASREFARTLPVTVRALPADQRPPGRLTAGHVAGTHTTAQREAALHLLHHPPDDGWTVICNARCLTEGVDVPTVDAVVFTGRKTSEVDIVQAVGRGLRRNPTGSGIATILVPVVLPDTPQPTADDLGEWETMCQVIRAMRAHDDVLAARLDLQRSRIRTTDPTDLDHSDRPALPDRVVLHLPTAYQTPDVLHHVTVRLLEETTNTWWASFGQLRAFHAQHRHFRVPEGTPLANWSNTQRRHRRRGMLDPERIAALDDLGFDWEPRQREQEAGLAAARAFHAVHGHLRVPDTHQCDGINLVAWLHHQRARNHAGTLPAELKTELSRLGMRWDRAKIVKWQDAYDLAAAFYADHRHLRPPAGDLVCGFDLYFWLCKQRVNRRRGKLSAQRVAMLDEIGMLWDLDQVRWDASFSAAAAFLQRENHLQPPTQYRERGIHLYAWLAQQRKLHAHGSLSTPRVERLASIGVNLRNTPNQ